MFLGTLVNAGAILLGGSLGLLLKKGIPERLSQAVMTALGMAVVLLGLQGALKGEKTLLLIVCMALGALIGTALKLDARFNDLAQSLSKRLGKGEDSPFKEGLVSATVLFCAGAMGITGAMQEGMGGEHTLLFTKAFLDGVSAFLMASALGAGVLCSAVPLLLYQGLFTLLGAFFAAFFGQLAGEIGAIGSLLLLPIGLNMMGVGKFKVMDLLPAVFLPLLLYWLF